jgi:hypothetical protein
MNNYEVLAGKADEFAHIAKKVNDSSQLRVRHSTLAIKFSKLSLDIGKILYKDMKKVAALNTAHRDQDSVTLNTCNILRLNLTEQREILSSLDKTSAVDSNIKNKLTSLIDGLEGSISEAEENLKSIILLDNRILYKDRLLLNKKKSQVQALTNLINLGKMLKADSKNAVKGSSENLERGKRLAEEFAKVKAHISKGDDDALKKLLADAALGRETAENVNKNSATQIAFAEKVRDFTRELLLDANEIRDIVNEKHLLFEENLQIITVLTVIIAMKFKNYLEAEKLISEMNFSGAEQSMIFRLRSLIKIALDDITFLTSISYDMTGTIQKNNEIEAKSVSMTSSEVDYFKKIGEEVELMTAATRYPVEGSAQNMAKAGELEKILREMIK